MKSLVILLLLLICNVKGLRSQPYPPGNISIKYDKQSKEQCATGSDSFQVTWAYSKDVGAHRTPV